MFEKIIGNEKNKTILKKALELNKTSHSYLFWGTEGIGKKKIALEFAKKLLCLTPNEENCRCKACIEFDSNNNPDFMMIEPQDGKVKIDQIREMQRKVAEKPIVSDNKVYIIDDSDTMTSEAQNCLLKTLEEPPEYVTIILICSNEDNMLSTIKSRCTRIHFENLEISEVKEYIKQNYGEEYLTNLIVSKNLKHLQKTLPYLQSIGVLEIIKTSASILMLTVEEIKERQAFIESIGETIVIDGKFNRIFGMPKKRYQKKVKEYEEKKKLIGKIKGAIQEGQELDEQINHKKQEQK